MPNTPLSGLPYPAGSQAPVAAADFMALADALDPVVPTVVADVADRDGRLINAPAGKIAVTTDGWMWVKTSPPGTAGWLTLKSVESTTAFTWLTNWDDAGTSKIIRNGDQYEMNFAGVYTGANPITADGAGNIGNTTMATIPDGWGPGVTMGATAIIGSSYGAPAAIWGASGRGVAIVNLPAGLSISPGNTVIVHASYRPV